MGIFAQDSWTIDRLTLNWASASSASTLNRRQDVGAGRFAPERASTNAEHAELVRHRAAIWRAYDLFGDARTALKASFNRYMAGQTLGFPARYNPLRARRATRGPGRDPNGDDIAQDNEIGPRTIRLRSAGARRGPPDDIAREHDWDTASACSTSCGAAVADAALVPPQLLQYAADRSTSGGAERLHRSTS